MNDLKSISEIAAALGVTRQAVYKKIKSNPELSTRLQEFTVNRGKTTVYSLQGQELIKQTFENGGAVNGKPNVYSKPKTTDGKLIDSLQAQVELISKQLSVKDSQIASLQSQVSTLTETVKELTIALKAAQALHGMDKQQKAIDLKPAEPERRSSSELRPQKQPSKKRSFTERLRDFFKN